MNPLIVFFFAALFIDDYFFKDGKLLKYYITATFLYWIVYFCSAKSQYHSPQKKLIMASYSQSYDPTIYGSLKPNIAKAKIFIDQLEKKTGKKITWTLFFAKIVSEIFAKYPEFNQTIKFGLHKLRGSVDVSVLVDVAGKDVAFVLLREVNNKTFSQLYDEMYPKIQNLRNDKDEEFNKQTNLVKFLPSLYE